jgi:hypothetical protein
MLTARFLGGSGDFSVKTPDGLEIWSTSSSTRVKKPDISLPLSVSSSSGQESGLISWLLGTRSMTGEAFDALGLSNIVQILLMLTSFLVSGPNRPPLPSNVFPNSNPSSGNELHEAMAATKERGCVFLLPYIQPSDYWTAIWPRHYRIRPTS